MRDRSQPTTEFTAPLYAPLILIVFTILFGAIALYAGIALSAVVRSQTVTLRVPRIGGLAGLALIALGLTVGFGFWAGYLLSLRATISDQKIGYESWFDHEVIPLDQVERVSARLVSHKAYLGESWVEITTPMQKRRLCFRFMPSATLPFEMQIVARAHLRLTSSGDYVR